MLLLSSTWNCSLRRKTTMPSARVSQLPLWATGAQSPWKPMGNVVEHTSELFPQEGRNWVFSPNFFSSFVKAALGQSLGHLRSEGISVSGKGSARGMHPLQCVHQACIAGDVNSCTEVESMGLGLRQTLSYSHL